MMVGALAATLDQAVFLRMEASAEIGGDWVPDGGWGGRPTNLAVCIWTCFRREK